ncbi:hypothetical protein CR513_28044, partial [Mucuna pruriens]
MKNFRSISLYNVAYKIVTKILSQRLRHMMQKLVHSYQSSFIPSRQGLDNIIIAKGKVGWMATKINITLNGEALEEFKPLRGIQQGDPLSSTFLSYALKDYFSLLMWLWRIKFGILFSFLKGDLNSYT